MLFSNSWIIYPEFFRITVVPKALNDVIGNSLFLLALWQESIRAVLLLGSIQSVSAGQSLE